MIRSEVVDWEEEVEGKCERGYVLFRGVVTGVSKIFVGDRRGFDIVGEEGILGVGEK